MAKQIVPTITTDRLRELVDYDQETGLFSWRFGRVGAKKGVICGSPHPKNRYIGICLDYKRYLAHRLAWMYVYGAWPSASLDHIDGNRANNRIDNLRLADHSINNENRHSARSDSTTGLVGVEVSRDRFIARIQVKGKRIGLGTFDTAEDAHAAYIEAKKRLHLGYVHGA